MIPIRIDDSYVPSLTSLMVMEHAEKIGAERLDELDKLLYAFFNFGYKGGVNPDVLVGMSNLETDNWRSEAWVTRLNPGGIGITDQFDNMISFNNGTNAGLAMTVHLMAYCQGHNNYFAPYIHLDPRFVKVHEAGFAAVADTLDDLGDGKWATDPLYAEKVAGRIEQLKGGNS